MEDKVSLTDSDIVQRFKSQIILFYACMNKANEVRKICKLLSNCPVRILRPCQTTVRESEREQGPEPENTKNYWISFSCFSLPISLSNFSSHQNHGSVLHAWRADSFSCHFEKRGSTSQLCLPPSSCLVLWKTQFLPANRSSPASLRCRCYQEGIFKSRRGGKKILCIKTGINLWAKTCSVPHI